MKLEVSITKQLPEYKLEIDFNNQAKTLALFGPSGSGKTTILNIISGIETDFEGKITLDERVLFSSPEKIYLPPEKREIGYVLQESLLFPHMNVKQNLLYGFYENKALNWEKVVHLLELENLLERSTMEISGGQKQRVALGRALLSSPKLLLLDEPLSNLDSYIKSKIIFYLNKIKKEFSLPMIYVTHSIEEVVALAEEVIVINEGKIIDKGAPSQVLENPSVLPVAEITGLENIFDIEITEHCSELGITKIKIGNQEVILPFLSEPIPSKIGIAANEIILATTYPQKISARNILTGKIKNIQQLANKIVIVHIDIGKEKTLFSEITIASFKELNITVNKEIYVIFKSNSIKLLTV